MSRDRGVHILSLLHARECLPFTGRIDRRPVSASGWVQAKYYQPYFPEKEVMNRSKKHNLGPCRGEARPIEISNRLTRLKPVGRTARRFDTMSRRTCRKTARPSARIREWAMSVPFRHRQRSSPACQRPRQELRTAGGRKPPSGRHLLDSCVWGYCHGPEGSGWTSKLTGITHEYNRYAEENTC